jgi:hypothetical protein
MKRLLLAIGFGLLASIAVAAPDVDRIVKGKVVATRTYSYTNSYGDVQIVTDLTIQIKDGTLVNVTFPGGTLSGVVGIHSHVPVIPSRGQKVHLQTKRIGSKLMIALVPDDVVIED